MQAFKRIHLYLDYRLVVEEVQRCQRPATRDLVLSSLCRLSERHWSYPMLSSRCSHAIFVTAHLVRYSQVEDSDISDNQLSTGEYQMHHTSHIDSLYTYLSQHLALYFPPPRPEYWYVAHPRAFASDLSMRAAYSARGLVHVVYSAR